MKKNQNKPKYKTRERWFFSEGKGKEEIHQEI